MTPLYVFIDTSIFEAHHFQVANEPLLSVAQAADQGYVRLLIPKIAHAEIQKRLKARANVIREALREARKKCTVAKGTVIEPLKSLFAEESWFGQLETELAKRYADFIHDRCVAVSRPPGATNEVFEAYFNSLPPFDAPEKKHEFPDAFIIAALRAWQRKSGEEVVVASADGDFRRALNGVDGFRICDSCEKLLQYIYSKKLGYNKVAESIARLEKRKIAAALRNAFSKRVLILDDADQPVVPKRIQTTSVAKLTTSKIEVKAGRVGVRLTALFRFKVTENDPVDIQRSDDSADDTQEGETPPFYPVHRVYGDQFFVATLPAHIVFKPSRDSRSIETFTHIEINDGRPLELSTFRYQR